MATNDDADDACIGLQEQGFFCPLVMNQGAVEEDYGVAFSREDWNAFVSDCFAGNSKLIDQFNVVIRRIVTAWAKRHGY